MAFSSGMMIGKYELGRKLGEGGFGLVFIGRDSGLDREVALKFLHPEHTANPEILRRFLQEARSAAKIAHPGIVTVYECGQVTGTNTSSDGVAYIAMELLRGESLTDRLARSGRLPARAAMEMARQLASALEAAHLAGIIHRDLKPDNIFLVTDPAMPGGERVKVLDFGIAKLAQNSPSGVQTQSMMVFGTPRYMSPEQCRSAAHIDHRSDIYTLGCILFELVCGAPPFSGETGELIAKHQLVPPPTARSIAGDVPHDLAKLIASMLAKEPKDRPQTMAAVQRALEAGGVIPTGVEPTLPPDATESVHRFTPPPGSLRMPAPVPETQLPSRSPAASPTTLGGASGEWQHRAKPRSKLPLVLGGLAVLAIAGGGIFVATRDKAQPEQAPASQVAHQPVAAPEPPSPPAPVAPAEIELVLDATPKAEVFTLDGRLLGETPYTDKRAPDRGKVVFLLKAPGHVEQRVLMPADKSDKQLVTLAASPIATKVPAKSPSTRRPAARSPSAGSAQTKVKAGDAGEDHRFKEPVRTLKPGELPDE